MIKFIKEAAKAICLILCFASVGLLPVSVIGNNNKEPIKGTTNSNVSILLIKF